MYIVSANYFDRDSENRWLIRLASQTPKETKPFPAVVMTGVRFVDSNAIEEGFGCRVVAATETAQGSQTIDSELQQGEVELSFDGWGFVTEDNESVYSCASLRLTPDGSMYAVLTADSRKEPEEDPEEEDVAEENVAEEEEVA